MHVYMWHIHVHVYAVGRLSQYFLDIKCIEFTHRENDGQIWGLLIYMYYHNICSTRTSTQEYAVIAEVHVHIRMYMNYNAYKEWSKSKEYIYTCMCG